eukprot:CAMPEP_0172573912 /NCGR_PEP_ID=MMETSP1067-20121228/136436_1 /TAXON_ID=265564 ORGANISM="Thalassiosira punctigera, Strain Tpunct2005C2" /NCGR_SAMPLE_ID=MMETSP1067 /ASSEMBLY_ACC=CAM_ASM_000444 /LENGTH=619 /DNA_ID=CAMNT_0013366535 /DNA_START=1527 /DNA_END=3386 /DNA_ORIENTATION=-
MADTIEDSFRRHWDREFVVVAGHDDKKQAAWGKSSMTYGEAEMASSAVAKWMTTAATASDAKLYRPGDIAAIFMPSGCEFVVVLFGLIRCGVRAALVNTGLRGNSLVHALTSALEGDRAGNKTGPAVKAVLTCPSMKPVLESLREEGRLPRSLAIVECGAGCELDPWQMKPLQFPFLGRNQRYEGRSPRWDDTCLYIYTSGTTGLPKASKMNHMRIWSGGCLGRKVCRLGPRDRLYCPLPLYHASGLTLGLGGCLQSGSTTVVRPQFSVRQYSQDILTHRCTSVQYIGEMARYLVSAPPNPLDSKVSLRFAFGNGMPAEIWISFQKRYNIDIVHEFYASTEGNVNIVNNTGMAPGACGIVPPGFGWIYPIGIFLYDEDSGELMRDKRTGLCVPAGPNEPGELLGLIKESDPSRRFDGYTNDAATQSKVVVNVCKAGDRYFRSGDLLRKDRCGFLYFCDRMGETFRWKGENVSTSEVARALLGCCADGKDTNIPTTDDIDELGCFVEAVVYGVEVKGNPGRAGMATVVTRQTNSGSNEWQNLLWHSLQADLPRYAQPLFVRLAKEIEKTATQKYKKNTLQKDSFLDCGSDPIYFRDDTAQTFVLMEETIKQEILGGKRKV